MFFSGGFDVFFEGEEQTLLSHNSQSAMENEEAVDGKIGTELGKGRLGGPFKEQPFPNFKCSPLAILKMLLLNITFSAVHIPGVTNILADRISRFQDVKQLLEVHRMSPEPTPLPREVHPANFKI